MQMRGWTTVVLAGLVFVAGMSGCKKRPPKAGPGDIGNVGGVTGSGLYGEEMGLGPRWDGGQETRGQFAPVYFDYDSAQIKDSERSKLDAVASYMRGARSVGVIVEGHCDERGSNEYNLALGERRALAVRAYLVGLGIDGNRVQTKSLGEEQPVAMGHDEGSWSQNRRGEFVLVK